MTEQEISKLAREYENDVINRLPQEVRSSITLDTRAELRHDFTVIAEWLLHDHCIVKKSEVINQHSFYMQRMKEVSSARQTNRAKAIALENCFGTDLFKERSEK